MNHECVVCACVLSERRVWQGVAIADPTVAAANALVSKMQPGTSHTHITRTHARDRRAHPTHKRSHVVNHKLPSASRAPPPAGQYGGGLPCPVNFYCPAGNVPNPTWVPVACPANTFSAAGAKDVYDCQVSPSFSLLYVCKLSPLEPNAAGTSATTRNPTSPPC